MIYDGERPGDKDTFNDLERIVRRTTRALRPHLDRFDGLAVTGVSGDSVGFPAALRLRKPIVSIRKTNNHHNWTDIAGLSGLPLNARLLFLDDFVSGGVTRARVNKAISETGHRLVGQYLYSGFGHWQLKDGNGHRTEGALFWLDDPADPNWRGANARW